MTVNETDSCRPKAGSASNLINNLIGFKEIKIISTMLTLESKLTWYNEGKSQQSALK